MAKRNRETIVIGEPPKLARGIGKHCRNASLGCVVPGRRKACVCACDICYGFPKPDPGAKAIDVAPAVSETADRGDTKRTDPDPS